MFSGLTFSSQIRWISRGGEVGAGDVVAGEEGEAGVVVLEIQRGAQPRGELIHKAEHAFVGAVGGLIHQVLGKVQPQILSLVLLHADFSCPAELQQQLLLVGVEHIIQHVVDLVVIDI